VTNTPDVLTDDVADLAIGLMLAAMRGIAVADRYVRAGAGLRANMGLQSKVSGKALGSSVYESAGDCPSRRRLRCRSHGPVRARRRCRGAMSPTWLRWRARR
jgi:lactate dehydrogenase-like 2-hydroxyacid dehydrogenase